MKRLLFCILLLGVVSPPSVAAQGNYETDIIDTPGGKLEITFIGHGTLMLRYGKSIIHVDPWTRLADYTDMPKADLILVTHEHGDHLDPGALEILRTEKTALVLTASCARAVKDGIVMANGDVKTIRGFEIEAVPAYNIVHLRGNGAPFHPRGVGNGYVISFGGSRIYVAGDTENTPEMKRLKDIDIAFLPMNLPYTMTPQMVADAAMAFRPRILYPYHYGDTETSEILKLLKDASGIEVRIRRMR